MTSTTREQDAIRGAVQNLLTDHCHEAAVRATMETPSGFDPALWSQLADIGITGLLIPEEYGGAGLGPVELELVMEETGAALLCSPMLSSGVLAAGLLLAADDPDAQARLLPGIAAGTTIATVAMTGDAGNWTPDGVSVTATTHANSITLDGAASFVTHGVIADVVLVIARTANGFGVFEVARAADGLVTSALPAFDRTQRLSRMTFSRTPATPVATSGWPAVEAALRLAVLARSGEQVGGARRIFDMTGAYAKTRTQFGRPIGGFQAIKHMATDLLLDVESATSAARDAARQLAEGTSTADEAACLAAFVCADAYVKVAATAIQMHGGIAFTWEHPAHLYLRRARGHAQLFGTSQDYRERYITRLGA